MREISTATMPQRRSKWKGVVVPAYPDGSGQPRQPRITQIQNALAGTGPLVWKVWLQRLALVNPARWAALNNAFQSGKALRGTRYVSCKPCRQCGGRIRTAVLNRCAACYKSTRFNSMRQHTEQQLHQREVERQQQESAALVPCVVAGNEQGWIVMCNAEGVRFWHPSKTQRVLRHLEPMLHKHFIQHDEQYRDLFLFAVENQPLPEWATIMYQS